MEYEYIKEEELSEITTPTSNTYIRIVESGASKIIKYQKAITDYLNTITSSFLKKDGSVLLDAAFTPSVDRHIATKKYVVDSIPNVSSMITAAINALKADVIYGGVTSSMSQVVSSTSYVSGNLNINPLYLGSLELYDNLPNHMLLTPNRIYKLTVRVTTTGVNTLFVKFPDLEDINHSSIELLFPSVATTTTYEQSCIVKPLTGEILFTSGDMFKVASASALRIDNFTLLIESITF